MKTSLGPALTDLKLRTTLKHMADQAFKRGDTLLSAILQSAVRTLDCRPVPGAIDRRDTIKERRNINLNGRRTTIYLERAFWASLERIAEANSTTMDAVCAAVCVASTGASLASDIRVYLLKSMGKTVMAIKD